MTYTIILDWLQASLRWASPLIICSIGEIYSERSGIINMGIEGIMLCGALAGVAVCYYANSQFAALCVCAILGALLGTLVAFLTVSRRTNQVVTGLMINMLATGATNLIFALMTETRHKRAATFAPLFPKVMQKLPFVGEVFFAQPFSTWIALLLPFIAAFILYKTRWGLNVRACGDNPHAAAAAGLSVIKIKYQTVILSGIFAALAGCVLTLASSGYFAAGGMRIRSGGNSRYAPNNPMPVFRFQRAIRMISAVPVVRGRFSSFLSKNAHPYKVFKLYVLGLNIITLKIHFFS